MNENRNSQVQRLKVVEKDREALEGAKEEAEAYLQNCLLYTSPSPRD